MGGKSGGGGTNANDLEIKRMEMEAKDRDRLREETRQNEANALSVLNARRNLGDARENARNRGYYTLAQRGLDAREYGSVIDDAISGVASRIDPKDENAAQHFTDSVFDDALARARDNARVKYGNAVNQQFAPDVELGYFGQNADDRFIGEIIGRQRKEAEDYVTRARGRGMLDDTGYNSAIQRINEMEASGRSTADKLGAAVLQGNRTKLADIANSARSGASQYELGSQFDVGGYQRRFDDAVNNMNTTLQGDIYGALEGQKFFDVGDIIARGGSKQGAVNPATENADNIAQREKLRTTRRGVGSAGGTF